MKKTLIYYLVLFLIIGFMGNVCFAQNQEPASGFSITPFFQEVNLDKNVAEEKFSLEIANNTQTSAVFKLSVLDFGALDESGGVAFLGAGGNLENKYSLASWVSLEKDAVVVNPGEKQSVQVAIQNKESLSPGGHYGAIMAKLEPEKTNSGQGASDIAFEKTLSSLIFVRKIGGEIYGLDFKSQEMAKNLFNLSGTVRLRFQNTGNVHVTPRGTVKIFDPLGREVMNGIINQESAIILPETFRIFPIELRNIAFAFMPGKYVSKIEYRFDGKEDFVLQQESFFFVPPVIFFVLVSILLALGLFWLKLKKK